MTLLSRTPLRAVMVLGLAAYLGHPAYLYALSSMGVDLEQVQFSYGIYLVRYLMMFIIGLVTFAPATRLGSRIKRNWIFDLIALASLFLIIVRGVYQDQTRKIILGSALLIFGLSHDAGLSRVVAGNQATRLLGEWSYSLYLSHILVFFLIVRVATDMRYRFDDLPIGVTSAIALVVAAALHHGIERPARTFLRNGFRSPTPSAKTIALQSPQP